MTMDPYSPIQQAERELEQRTFDLIKYIRPKHSVSGEWIAVFAGTEEAVEAIIAFRAAEKKLETARAVEAVSEELKK